MPENLIEAIQSKCREIREEMIPTYESIGPASFFAVSMMKQSVAQAERAIANADTVGMVSALKDLREYKY
jgi:hypothetical protein